MEKSRPPTLKAPLIGSGDRLVVPAQQSAHNLANDQPDRIGAEHGDDRHGVKPFDDRAFEQKPDQTHDDRCCQDPGPSAKPVLAAEIDCVGAEQDQFAMREIEDAHHARDHAEPKHDQHHDGGESEDIERKFNREIHSLSYAAQSDGRELLDR